MKSENYFLSLSLLLNYIFMGLEEVLVMSSPKKLSILSTN